MRSCGTEYRLSRLYVTNTPDPLVQRRTRAIVESPSRASLDALPTSPIYRPRTVEAKPSIHEKPFIPTGPIVACLVRFSRCKCVQWAGGTVALGSRFLHRVVG